MAMHQYIQLSSLPEEVRRKVEAFIARLMEEWEKGRKPEANKEEEAPQRRVFGIAKGMAAMTEDFDEPLDDMKDYME